MTEIINEISKEKYDECQNIKYPMLMDKFDIPIQWTAGYGYYGCTVFQKDGKYFVKHLIGSTCD